MPFLKYLLGFTRMSTKRNSNCFACGKDNPIGLHLKVDSREGMAKVEFTPTSPYEGYSGYIHGGIISTLLDEVMVWAAKSLGIKAVTAELSVRFKKPVLIDEPIIIDGKITDIRKKLLYGEAFIYSEENKVLATATGKLVGME